MSEPRFTANPAWAIQHPNGTVLAFTTEDRRNEAIRRFVKNGCKARSWAWLYRRGYRAVKVWLRTEARDG